MIARAPVDNRIGGFIIAEVARLLQENKKLPFYALYVVNAVQEEVGLRGAEMIARPHKTRYSHYYGCYTTHKRR